SWWRRSSWSWWLRRSSRCGGGSRASPFAGDEPEQPRAIEIGVDGEVVARASRQRTLVASDRHERLDGPHPNPIEGEDRQPRGEGAERRRSAEDRVQAKEGGGARMPFVEVAEDHERLAPGDAREEGIDLPAAFGRPEPEVGHEHAEARGVPEPDLEH